MWRDKPFEKVACLVVSVAMEQGVSFSAVDIDAGCLHVFTREWLSSSGSGTGGESCVREMHDERVLTCYISELNGVPAVVSQNARDMVDSSSAI